MRARLLAWTISTVVGVALIAGGMALSLTPAVDDAPAESRARTVSVTPARRDDGLKNLRLSSVIRARAHAQLSFTLAGRVRARPVQLGDRVESGQVLVELDARGLKHQVELARASRREVVAQLNQAARDRRRTRKLSRSEAASRADLERLSASVRQLKAGHSATKTTVAEAERLLSEARLLAPFDGVVTEVWVDEGEFVGPGQPVVTLDGDDGHEIELEVPEAFIAKIHPGDEARIALPLADVGPLRGRVRTVGVSASTEGRVFPVIIDVEASARVLPGMAAEVDVQVQGRAGLQVPLSSIQRGGERSPYVFVVDDGRARRVPVEIVGTRGSAVIVNASFSAGASVVVGGRIGLLDGDPVETRALTTEEPSAADRAGPPEAEPSAADDSRAGELADATGSR